MSKMQAYLTSDDKAVSSLLVPGFRKVYNRVLLRKTKAVNSKMSRFIHPCPEHDGNEPTITVDVWEWDEADKSNQPVGSVRICFFCWGIIELKKQF